MAPTSSLDVRCPSGALKEIFERVFPKAGRAFAQGGLLPLRLLSLNDWVMEKAFVYGIICLSKWMGEEEFPCGVYTWPPPMPEPPAPARGASRVGDVDEEDD